MFGLYAKENRVRRLSPAVLAATLVVAVVVVLLAGLVAVRFRSDAQNAFLRNQKQALAEQKQVVQLALSAISADMEMLGRMVAVRGISPDASAADRNPLVGELLNFARTSPGVDQLRFLTPEGLEILNIKRIRSRSGSVYFRDTSPERPRDLTGERWTPDLLALPAGVVGFDGVDWKSAPVSRPATSRAAEPVLRVGIAVSRDGGRGVAGLLVGEFLLDGMLEDLGRQDHAYGTDTLLADASGRWIRSPGGTVGLDARDVGEFWTTIRNLPSGSEEGDFGLVVFDSVSLPGASGAGAMSAAKTWKIFTWHPSAILDEIAFNATRPVLGWAILALALFVPLVFLIATDRRQKQAALRVSERSRSLVQSITDTSVDGIIAAEAERDGAGDIRDFRVVFANPAAAHFYRMLGREAAASRLEFPAFVAPDFFAQCVQVVATGARYETEFSSDADALGTRWFRVGVVKLDAGVVVSLCDVTEQKLIMHELRVARDAAEVANRAKSQFLTMMGHEIRTPMNGLLGFASLLDRTPLNEEQRDYLSTLRNSGEALLRILEDILDYSHMELETLNIKSVPVDVRELVTQVSRLFALAVGERNLELVTKFAPEIPPQILADDVRVRQILVNLVGNAVKFTDEGFILLKVERAISEAGDFLFFHVVDSGPGVPPEMVDRLFKPFSQVDAGSSRRYGGTGLGLSICRRLVETMGGEVGVRTAPDKGSDFYFSLPVRLPQFPSRSVLPRPSEADRPRKRRVLVVDDDVTNRKLIRRMIEKVGAEAELVGSGTQALQAFAEDEFDLILMDLQMPGMDGVETTRRIREMERQSGTGRRTPISALTANAGEGDRERCLEAGMDDFFYKPIRIEALEDLIARVAL